MTPNELKNKIQTEGVEYSKKFPFYVAEFATGAGKSLTFIKIMEELGGTWNLVVAETNHKQNWKDEFIKHKKEHLLKNIRMFCYASLHKHLGNTQYCFDEMHHILTSKKRLSLLESLSKGTMKRMVGLSATLSWKQKENLKSFLPQTYIHKVSLSQAIEVGILPTPTIYLVEVPLDEIIPTEVYNFNREKSKRCSQREWYRLQSGRIEYFKDKYFETREEKDKRKWMMSGGVRKRFLAECKTEAAKRLLERLKEKRLICFTHSIAQSEELSKGNSIHSDISLEVRQGIIDNFNKGKIDKLYTTRMLREGMNLNNIEAGVMVQLDNNTKSFVQPAGRVFRSLSPEYYILYVPNTQDETYLTTALEGFDKSYVKTLTIY